MIVGTESLNYYPAHSYMFAAIYAWRSRRWLKARTHNNNDVSSEGIDDDIDIAYASFSRLGFLRMKFFLGG